MRSKKLADYQQAGTGLPQEVRDGLNLNVSRLLLNVEKKKRKVCTEWDKGRMDTWTYVQELKELVRTREAYRTQYPDAAFLFAVRDPHWQGTAQAIKTLEERLKEKH